MGLFDFLFVKKRQKKLARAVAAAIRKRSESVIFVRLALANPCLADRNLQG